MADEITDFALAAHFLQLLRSHFFGVRGSGQVLDGRSLDIRFFVASLEPAGGGMRQSDLFASSRFGSAPSVRKRISELCHPGYLSGRPAGNARQNVLSVTRHGQVLLKGIYEACLGTARLPHSAPREPPPGEIYALRGAEFRARVRRARRADMRAWVGNVDGGVTS